MPIFSSNTMLLLILLSVPGFITFRATRYIRSWFNRELNEFLIYSIVYSVFIHILIMFFVIVFDITTFKEIYKLILSHNDIHFNFNFILLTFTHLFGAPLIIIFIYLIYMLFFTKMNIWDNLLPSQKMTIEEKYLINLIKNAPYRKLPFLKIKLKNHDNQAYTGALAEYNIKYQTLILIEGGIVSNQDIENLLVEADKTNLELKKTSKDAQKLYDLFNDKFFGNNGLGVNSGLLVIKLSEIQAWELYPPYYLYTEANFPQNPDFFKTAFEKIYKNNNTKDNP